MGHMGKIVAADDDAMVLEVISKSLYGHDVLTASNGQEALDLVRKENPDLVILDIAMPVMDGIQACKTIKWDPKLKHIPVLMLTGKGGFSNVEESFDAQANDMLMKPFSPRVLVAHVADLLKINT